MALTHDRPFGVGWFPTTLPIIPEPSWIDWHPEYWQQPSYRPFTPPYGWICPRCLKVWAPSVVECDCHPPTVNTTVTATGGSVSNPPDPNVRVVFTESESAEVAHGDRTIGD
jgi:hypothetical protein